MQIRLSILFAAALLAAAPHRALADGIPNLTGTWKGTVDSAIHVGSTPDRAAKDGKAVTFATEAIVFTFTISEQQGARFAGEMSTDKRSETLIGHLMPDNRNGMMLDDDGQYAITLRDAGTMDVCYSHSKPDSKVIACWTATKAP